MRKLVALFVFLAITGMTTACEESPLGLPETASPPPAELHGGVPCSELEGIPDPNGFWCDDEDVDVGES